MAENVQDWSTTAADNDDADSSINWAENQLPGTVNGSARAMMAAIRKYAKDTDGSLTASGSADALTVTTNQVLTSGNLANGAFLRVRAASANTSATVTFSPDGLTAAGVKRSDGSALVTGMWAAGQILDLAYTTSTSEWWATNIPPVDPAIGDVGLVLLTSGTVTSASTLDISLATYTDYRGIKIQLYLWRPVTDGAALWARVSTDGATFDSASYAYAAVDAADASALAYPASRVSASASAIVMTESNCGNDTGEHGFFELDILSQTQSAYPHIKWSGSYLTQGAGIETTQGAGTLKISQDTVSVRLMYSTGNITTGQYAVYGYA